MTPVFSQLVFVCPIVVYGSGLSRGSVVPRCLTVTERCDAVCQMSSLHVRSVVARGHYRTVKKPRRRQCDVTKCPLPVCVICLCGVYEV